MGSNLRKRIASLIEVGTLIFAWVALVVVLVDVANGFELATAYRILGGVLVVAGLDWIAEALAVSDPVEAAAGAVAAVEAVEAAEQPR